MINPVKFYSEFLALARRHPVMPPAASIEKLLELAHALGAHESLHQYLQFVGSNGRISHEIGYRQLIQNAIRDLSEQRNPKAARLLKDLIDYAAGTDNDGLTWMIVEPLRESCALTSWMVRVTKPATFWNRFAESAPFQDDRQAVIVQAFL